MSVDAAGDAFVTGGVAFSDFPLVNSIQGFQTPNGYTATSSDGGVTFTKTGWPSTAGSPGLNAIASGSLTGLRNPEDIAVDASGNIYVADSSAFLEFMA